MDIAASTLARSVSPRVLMLCLGSPWPPHSGAALRHLGLLEQLRRGCDVDLLVLTRQPLSPEQRHVLARSATSVTEIPLRDVTLADRARAAIAMLRDLSPYHNAVVARSVRAHPEARRLIERFDGVVYASMGQIGALVRDRDAPHWVLDQHNADVHVWEVMATEARNPLRRLVATLNLWLCRREFPRIYRHVSRIISVCDEDAAATRALAATTPVAVIENGVDCEYYTPQRRQRSGPPRMLFTGTSVARNMRALHSFVAEVLPAILDRLPDAELLVGGRFDAAAQACFSGHRNVRFSGPVDDMRPLFDTSDVFVSPFRDAYGSKLKVAQAMAMAMPIVSTAAGVRGFPLTHGRSALVAESADQFASHCVALLTDGYRRERLGRAARAAAVALLDWRVLGDRLLALLGVEDDAGEYRPARRRAC